MATQLKKYSICFILTIFAYILVDYLNIPSLLGISIPNINTGFLELFLSSSLVIFLYLCTYWLIDRKNIEKSINKTEVYKQILFNTYQNCIDNIEFFSKEDILEKVVQKIDFNAPSNENKITNNIISLPFDNKDIIFDLTKSGEINVNTFQKYLLLQTEYRQYINMMITLFDKPDIINPLKIKLLKNLNQEIKNIINEEK